MQLTINGESKMVEGVTTLEDLVVQLDLERGRIATELNSNVVPKKDYPNTTLSGGDRLEIVTFVGGG